MQELTPLNLICAAAIAEHGDKYIPNTHQRFGALLPSGQLLQFRGLLPYILTTGEDEPGIYEVFLNGLGGDRALRHSLTSEALPKILLDLQCKGYITINDLPPVEQIAQGLTQYFHINKNPRHCPAWFRFDELMPGNEHSDFEGIINVQDINGQIHKIHYKEAIDNKENYRLWHPAYEGNAPCLPDR